MMFFQWPHHSPVLVAPLALQGVEPRCRLLRRGRVVDAHERSHHVRAGLGVDVTQTGPHQMHAAQLRQCPGKHRVHRLRQPFEAIHAGDVDFLYPALA